MKAIPWIVGVCVAPLGCAGNPATNLARTSEPLHLEVTRKTIPYDSHLEVTKTGDRSYRADRVVDYTSYPESWRFYQGAREIDEHDFFRLAGDQASADRIAAERKTSIRRRNLYATITLASIAAVVGGVVLIEVGGGFPEDMVTPTGTIKGEPSTTTTLGGLSLVLGTVVGGIGGILWWGGNKDVTKQMRVKFETAEAVAGSTECKKPNESYNPGCQIKPPKQSGTELPMRAVAETESVRLQLRPRRLTTMR